MIKSLKQLNVAYLLQVKPIYFGTSFKAATMMILCLVIPNWFHSFLLVKCCKVMVSYIQMEFERTKQRNESRFISLFGLRLVLVVCPCDSATSGKRGKRMFS